MTLFANGLTKEELREEGVKMGVLAAPEADRCQQDDCEFYSGCRGRKDWC